MPSGGGDLIFKRQLWDPSDSASPHQSFRESLDLAAAGQLCVPPRSSGSRFAALLLSRRRVEGSPLPPTGRCRDGYNRRRRSSYAIEERKSVAKGGWSLAYTPPRKRLVIADLAAAACADGWESFLNTSLPCEPLYDGFHDDGMVILSGFLFSAILTASIFSRVSPAIYL